jgi:hypothetical protein
MSTARDTFQVYELQHKEKSSWDNSQTIFSMKSGRRTLMNCGLCEAYVLVLVATSKFNVTYNYQYELKIGTHWI